MGGRLSIKLVFFLPPQLTVIRGGGGRGCVQGAGRGGGRSRALVAGWEGGTIDCVTSQLVTSTSSPLLPPRSHYSHALPNRNRN